MPRKPAAPTVSVRRHLLADGTTSQTYSVRFRNAQGHRIRRSFTTREEADFERASVALELSRHGSSAPVRSGPARGARGAPRSFANGR